VDLITCNFDSINHLLKFGEWKKTFINVYNNLNVGGRFLFDINTLYIITNYKERYQVEVDGARMDIKIYPKNNNILVFDIKAIIKKNNREKIIKEIIKETSFEYKKIKKSLQEIGFKKVIIFNKNLNIKSHKKRLYILAEK
jgi:hypothetical protein